MTALVLIGGGGHCKAAIDVVEAGAEIGIAGILERPDAPKVPVLGYPVIGTDADLAECVSRHGAVLVTLGQIKSAAPRQRAYRAAQEAGAALPVVISPRATVSRHALIGAGTLVMHGAVVGPAAEIGCNGILNSQSLVEHDARIGAHCHISTGARVNGGVTIGAGCFIGSGAVLKQGITIGANSVIGAGCVITHSQPGNSFVRYNAERAAS